MYALRRWWERHGLQLLFVSLALGTAWFVRETQGTVIYETYRMITYPFQVGSTREERLVNARVLELQQKLTELENQNQKLQELIGYTAKTKNQGIVAPVVGRSADHWWQQMTLGRGSKDGVKIGSIVTGAGGGLVGRVISLTPSTSRVLLISDPSSRVGVTVSRSRFTGFMRGQSTSQSVMEFFDKVPDVRAGDILVTSSFSQLFPAGLPIGRIVSLDLSKSPAPEAVIELVAPISHLEWVVIYPNSKASLEDLSDNTQSSTGEMLF